jgi:hypothetical protein
MNALSNVSTRAIPDDQNDAHFAARPRATKSE